MLTAPAVCLTSDSTMSNRDPNVSPDGSTVTWAKCLSDGTGCDIYVAQRAVDGAWRVVQLTDSTGEDILPETDGNKVTYASNAAGDFDIWFKDVDGSNDRTLVLTDVPGSIETNPTISGGAILFEREAPGSTNADLYLYRLTTNELFRLTDTPSADETLNALSLAPTGDLRVAWAQPDGLVPGHNDIHAVRAQLSGNQPPVNQPPVLQLAGSDHRRRGRPVGRPSDLRRHRDRLRRHRDGDLRAGVGKHVRDRDDDGGLHGRRRRRGDGKRLLPGRRARRPRAAGPVPRRPHRRLPDQQLRRDDHDDRQQAARPVAAPGV